MAERKKLIFIIPAYNEAENLPLLLKNLSSRLEEEGYPYTIIIIDDGSADATESVLKKFNTFLPLRVIRNNGNLGVGEVFRRGFKEALSMASPDDILITKEADNTSDINILPDMIKEIEGGSDVVLASCYASEGKIIGTSLYRRLLSGGANMLLRNFFPIDGVNTYSSFYRGYRAEIIFKASSVYGPRLIEENGFACMVELLIKLNRLKARITEVPLILYFKARKGKSKMKVLSTIRGYFRVIRNLRLYR
jgi:dolichol-phosphate mannosyltransferase